LLTPQPHREQFRGISELTSFRNGRWLSHKFSTRNTSTLRDKPLLSVALAYDCCGLSLRDGRVDVHFNLIAWEVLTAAPINKQPDCLQIIKVSVLKTFRGAFYRVKLG
jgi:hypothetical protein